jgi:hypothetical protein
MKYIVLGDGETYWGLDDCFMIDVPEEWNGEDIEDSLKGRRGRTYEIGSETVQLEVIRKKD